MKHLYTLMCAALAFSAQAQIKNATDIRPDAGSSNPFWLSQFKGRLVYMADSAGGGIEVYRTDQSDLTSRAPEVNPGLLGPTTVSHNYRSMVDVGGQMYLVHRKGNGYPDEL